MDIVLFDIFFLRVIDAFMDEAHARENAIRLCRVRINNTASGIEDIFRHLLDRAKGETLDHLQDGLTAAAYPSNDTRGIFSVVPSAWAFLFALSACGWVEILAPWFFLLLPALW